MSNYYVAGGWEGGSQYQEQKSTPSLRHRERADQADRDLYHLKNITYDKLIRIDSFSIK